MRNVENVGKGDIVSNVWKKIVVYRIMAAIISKGWKELTQEQAALRIKNQQTRIKQVLYRSMKETEIFTKRNYSLRQGELLHIYHIVSFSFETYNEKRNRPNRSYI